MSISFMRPIMAVGPDNVSHPPTAPLPPPGEIFTPRLVPATTEILSWLQRLPGPVAVAYKAGPTGFGLARALEAAGNGAGAGTGAATPGTSFDCIDLLA